MPVVKIIDKKTINRVLRVSRLRLTRQEYAELSKDLEEILNAFRVLDEVSPSVEPAFHPVETKNHYRRDVAKSFEAPEELLKFTETYKRYIKGPRVL